MSTCPNLTCEPRNVVRATTDIAGPGIIYAYLVSALLAVLSIVFGYLSDSLPESSLNETDRTVISSFQKCMPSKKTLAHMRAVYSKIKTILLFGRPPKPHRKLTRRQREEVVKRFILTLSDQQLATGLAILVAAVANQCTLTVWEFKLAFSLAWFSSTTHLATLDCLRDYFLEHGAVRNWRVFGMVSLLLLLMYSLIMSVASTDNTVPLQCTFRSFGSGDLVVLGMFDIVSAALTLLLLPFQYIVRIRRSYKQRGDRATYLERAMFKWRTKRLRKAFKPNKSELAYITEEAIAERVSFRRRQRLEHIRKSRGLRRHWLIAYRASETYSQSFLSLSPMLTFMIAFGFTQLYLSRWSVNVPIEIDTSMGVGQITPLFLLVLPVLIGAESYYEVQDASEMAQANEIARENAEAAAARHRRHTYGSNTDASLFPADLQHPTTCIATRGYEQLDSVNSGEDYNNLLPDLKRFFYLETKFVDEKSTVTLPKDGSGNKNEKSLLGLKAHLVSSYHLLVAQETALRATTLTSLIEYTCCTSVSAALGILIYIEGSGLGTTIASLILFGLCMIYKMLGVTSHVPLAWFKTSEADYQRLLTEARSRPVDTEYRSAWSRT